MFGVAVLLELENLTEKRLPYSLYETAVGRLVSRYLDSYWHLTKCNSLKLISKRKVFTCGSADYDTFTWLYVSTYVAPAEPKYVFKLMKTLGVSIVVLIFCLMQCIFLVKE